MLIRSTGLGRTELDGVVESLTPKGDYMIVVFQCVKPVKWRVRVAMSYGDMLTLIKLTLKARCMTFLLNITRAFRRAQPPVDY